MGAKPSAFLIPLEPEPTRSSFRCFPDPACSCLLLVPWHADCSEPCPHRLHSTLHLTPLPKAATSAALSLCTPGRGVGFAVRSVQPERPSLLTIYRWQCQASALTGWLLDDARACLSGKPRPTRLLLQVSVVYRWNSKDISIVKMLWLGQASPLAASMAI